MRPPNERSVTMIDVALYGAKSAGRNRAVPSPSRASPIFCVVSAAIASNAPYAYLAMSGEGYAVSPG